MNRARKIKAPGCRVKYFPSPDRNRLDNFALRLFWEIVGESNAWRVRHDGKAENVYETKEAAFEAAVAAASIALQGH